MEVTLDSLTDQLRAASTDVSNVTNQFLCLSNTQFLENRVYDDDNEIPSEEKKEEVKVRAVMLHCNVCVPLGGLGGPVGGT
jgi:WASH complex subunit FAM21